MKILAVLFLIMGLFVFSCGGDTVAAQNNNKCKDKVCTENATCQEDTGECKCDDGFVADGDKCIAEVEDKCKDKVCQDNASCNKETGECECNEGFIAEGSSCVTDLCKDVTCDSNEVCNKGKCECENGYFYSDELKQCVKDKKCEAVSCEGGYSCIGGTCYLDNECSVDNPSGVCPSITGEPKLLCRNGLCVTENDGSLQEGESCNPTTNDCVAGTVCVDSFNNNLFKCRAFCDMNADNSCGNDGVCAPYLGDYAQNTGICIKSDSECANNEDHCPQGFKCETMINARVCKAQGDTDLGNDCDNDINDATLDGCKEGLFCVGDEGDMQCRELCDPDLNNDNCNDGRCIALKDIDAKIHNSDIGLCLDLPKFCNTNEGVRDNPSCSDEGNDPVCLGDGTGPGMCFVDTCDTADANSCEGINKCTRSITSKLMCIPAGDIAYGQLGCVNPQDQNTTPDDIVPEKLCQQGLNCFQGKCMELCDPALSNSCVNDPNAICVDIHTFKAEYPAGLNGACINMSGGK